MSKTDTTKRRDGNVDFVVWKPIASKAHVHPRFTELGTFVFSKTRPDTIRLIGVNPCAKRRTRKRASEIDPASAGRMTEGVRRETR